MYQVFAFIVSYHFLRQGERCNSARNLECSYKYFGLIMGNEEWMPRNYTTVIKKKRQILIEDHHSYHLGQDMKQH